MALYKVSDYPRKITVEEYEEMRSMNALDDLYGSKIAHGLFPNCIYIPSISVENFKLCEKDQIQLVCTKVAIYFTNIINFAEKELLLDKYILNNLGINYGDDGSHALTGIITHKPFYEIAIIDPNSRIFTESDDGKLSQNATKLYRCLDNKSVPKTFYF